VSKWYTNRKKAYIVGHLRFPCSGTRIGGIKGQAGSRIKDGKLYKLVENPDEEEWELHISSIN
jgi:hypothetical protein